MQLKWLCLSSILISGFVIQSCKSSNEESIPAADRLYREYEVAPTNEKAEIYLDTLDVFLRDQIDDRSLVKPYLQKGVEVSMAQGLLSRSSGYLLPLLKFYPELEDRKEKLIALADIMHTLRKRHASSIIYKELQSKYPGDPVVESKGNLIDSLTRSQEDVLAYLSDQILVDPDESGINRNSSLRYVDGVEAYALISPEKPDVPLHLYRAAEVARSMRTFPKALSLYNWLIEDYPEYEKTPTAMFIKGFILEQDYNLKEEARQIYSDFINRYPNHQMAESASFLLANIDKTDEEIMESIEAKRKDNQ